jgi:hypothetical protein
LKAEHRRGRNPLKGRDGDRASAVLAAAGDLRAAAALAGAAVARPLPPAPTAALRPRQSRLNAVHAFFTDDLRYSRTLPVAPHLGERPVLADFFGNCCARAIAARRFRRIRAAASSGTIASTRDNPSGPGSAKEIGLYGDRAHSPRTRSRRPGRSSDFWMSSGQCCTCQILFTDDEALLDKSLDKHYLLLVFQIARDVANGIGFCLQSEIKRHFEKSGKQYYPTTEVETYIWFDGMNSVNDARPNAYDVLGRQRSRLKQGCYLPRDIERGFCH